MSTIKSSATVNTFEATIDPRLFDGDGLAAAEAAPGVWAGFGRDVTGSAAVPIAAARRIPETTREVGAMTDVLTAAR
jgi:hypothetical protein